MEKHWITRIWKVAWTTSAIMALTDELTECSIVWVSTPAMSKTSPYVSNQMSSRLSGHASSTNAGCYGHLSHRLLRSVSSGTYTWRRTDIAKDHTAVSRGSRSSWSTSW